MPERGVTIQPRGTSNMDISKHNKRAINVEVMFDLDYPVPVEVLSAIPHLDWTVMIGVSRHGVGASAIVDYISDVWVEYSGEKFI